MRLFQYAWDWGEVQTTTNYDEMIELMESADRIVAHNGHAFDWSTLYGQYSTRPLELAQEGRLIDTMILAHLVAPVPYSYTNRAGHTFYDASKPEQAMRYYSLDNLCFQFGLAGKVGNLQELAQRYNPPKTKVRDLDYGLIPLDDPEFLQYAVQDVEALRELYVALVQKQRQVNYDRDYLFREQEIAAVNAQISRNGIRIDTGRAQEKVDEQTRQRDELMEWLVTNYDFPTEGKQPWKSSKGKEAILNALSEYGITFDTCEEWTATAKGAPSFAGDTMLAITEGTEAEEFGKALAILQGQRSMAALALESTCADGRAHTDITMFQRSGRFSVSRPGITIYDNDNKDVFLADPGHVCVELDFSNADARAVAAMSGDRAFAVRFEEDENGEAKYDGHNLSGEAFFGEALYYSEFSDDGKPTLRPAAKAAGHALNYNIGARKLATTLNAAMKGASDLTFYASERDQDPWDVPANGIDTREMIDNFHRQYRRLKAWKDREVRQADELGYVTNAWQRRMPIDFAGNLLRNGTRGPLSRAYTQAPALLGQSTTREMMCDAILAIARMGPTWAKRLRGVIHDALVIDLPQEGASNLIPAVVGCMQKRFQPDDPYAMDLDFPVGVGPLTETNWKDGAH